MENYQLFMIADRQYRIDENIMLMKKIKTEIIKYEPIKLKLSILNSEYVRLNERLKKLDFAYKKYTDKNNLYYKSNIIQLLSEAIIEKDEQIKFANCLKEGNKNRNSNKLLVFLTSFKHFYQYQNELAYDTNNEKVSFFYVVYQYIKQYDKFKKNISFTIESNDIISVLLLKYEIEKRKMVEEVEKLNIELEDRRQFLWNYHKKWPILNQKLQEVQNKINQLSTSHEYMMYKQKIQEYSDLDIQNKNYQCQIENIKEINKQQYSKQKKCA